MEEKKDIPAQAIVEVVEFGPLLIRGNIVIKDLRRNTEESVNEVWLCRCGRSKNKPYCDDSHKK